MNAHSEQHAAWMAFSGIFRSRLAVATVTLLAGLGLSCGRSSAQNAAVPAKTEGVDGGSPTEKPASDPKAEASKAAPEANPSKNAPAPPTSPEPAPSSDTPKAFPAARYAALLEKSPFAIATAAPEPVAPVENFASNWFLSSFSKSRSKDGAEVYTVFVKSRDLSTRLMLVGEKPDEGVTLVAVEEAPNRAETVAVLRKGTDVGRVKFDQAAFAAAPPPPPPRPGAPGAAPGAVNASAAANRPVVVPSASKTSIPRPGMSAQPRSGVPSPPSAVPLPGAVPPPASPSGASSSQEPRRRVRPIESAPAPQ